jgi:mannose-6-phosphate isomerase-like protein (cupin superfamily)
MDTTQEANGHRAAAYLLVPGEVRRRPLSVPTVKADSHDTAGLLTVCEGALAPWESGPPLHLHAHNDEALYVVEGTLLVQIGEDRHELTPGTFAWIPRDTPHTFANAAETDVRAINISVPGGLEGLFAEQGEYFAHLHGAPDLAELGRMGARHGSRLLGAPIAADGAPARSPS